MEFKGGKIRLSAEERKAFFASEWPVLAGSGKPPAIPKGYVHALSVRLCFEVVCVHRARKGWWLEYRVIDDREERFHLLPAAASFETDEKGNLIDMPPEEEIGYTRNPKRRTIDDAPSVPPRVQHILDARSRLAEAQRRDDGPKQALRRFKAEVNDLVERAGKMGVDPMHVLAGLEREIQRQHEELGVGSGEAA